MRKYNFSRVLSVLLALLLLSQSVCLTAFAADDGKVTDVIIPSGSTAATVNEILTRTLLGEGAEVQNWEYSCEGRSKLGATNPAWGSIEGFTSTTGSGIFKVTYTHPALADNADGVYSVRVKGSTDDRTINKLSKPESSIVLNDSPSAPMAYREDGAVDFDAVRANIFRAVAASSTPELTANDVTIEYYAEAETGSFGGLGKNWVPLEGGKVSGLTYPAISVGTQEIRISWAGNDAYKGFSKEVTVEITSGKEASSIVLNDNAEVPMVYDDNGAADIAATKAALFSAVVASSTPELTVNDVTIEYYAEAESGSLGGLGKSWTPLEGGKVSGLTYPAISVGAQKIRISWSGNDKYDGFGPVEANITLTDRPAAPYTLKDPAGSVKLVYTEEQTVDYSTIEADVFNAVIEQSDVLTPDNVTIEYFAQLPTGSLTDYDKKWVPLTGGTGLYAGYPAIAEGSQKVRITFAGSRDYAAAVIEQTIEVKGREPMSFQLKEGPYEVGMVFTAAQGYDYDAVARAIYDAVVESTEPAADFDEMTVEYNIGTDAIPVFKPLNNSDALTKKFSDGTWLIRISWPGSRDYAPGSVTVTVTVSDHRIASAVALKDGVSFTYSKDVNAMKQAVLDSVIDWENSALPAKETLSVDDFVFTYNAELSLLDGADSDLIDSILNGNTIRKDVPFEGERYEIGGKVLGSFPQIGAGEQKIQVTYKGSAEYKPSAESAGTVTINKASVKVSVRSASLYVSEAKELDLVTTNPVDDFNVYVIYAGITSNVTTGIYLQLPESYTSGSAIVKLADTVLSGLGKPTLTEMMRDGITVGELRDLLHASEVIEALGKLGIDTGALGQIITVIDKLPAIGDNLRIAFGTPNRAGIYAVTAVTENRNYNTGVGVGALVLKADKAVLTWNQSIGKKISAADAKAADFGATLTVNGEPVDDQSSVRVLYSGFTSKWKPYSSTTTPPTEPGRYVMTVVVLGGNYLAAPITRSFQITK